MFLYLLLQLLQLLLQGFSFSGFNTVSSLFKSYFSAPVFFSFSHTPQRPKNLMPFRYSKRNCPLHVYFSVLRKIILHFLTAIKKISFSRGLRPHWDPCTSSQEFVLPWFWDDKTKDGHPFNPSFLGISWVLLGRSPPLGKFHSSQSCRLLGHLKLPYREEVKAKLPSH